MSIQFYTGSAEDLYTNPTKYTSGQVYVAILKTTYMFSASHSVADVLAFANGPAAPLQSKKMTISGTDKIFDAADINIDTVADIAVNKIFLYYVDGTNKPGFIVSNSIDGAPGTPIGGTTTISFSGGPNKVFKVNSSYVGAEGQHMFIYNELIEDYIRLPHPKTRPGGAITYAERIIDKTNNKSSMYVDISATGIAHPLTGDMATASAQTAINQSLRNILLTNPTERPFDNIDFGAGLNSWLFELADIGAKRDIESAVRVAVTNNEQRISITDIKVDFYPEQWALSVAIFYTIRMTNTAAKFDLFLNRV